MEVHATFHRLPSESAADRWHDQAPDRFRFAVKGSRYVTHMLELGDDRLERFLDVLPSTAFFDNDHDANAPHDAQLLVELLGDAAVSW